MNMVHTILNFESTTTTHWGGTQYYYIDLFGLNQHDLAEINQGGATDEACPSSDDISRRLLETLDKSISTAQIVLVAANAWDEPAPLRRIWCLYELARLPCANYETPT